MIKQKLMPLLKKIQREMVTLNIKPAAVKFMIFLIAFAFYTASAPLNAASGNDLYKLCVKCGLKVPKNEGDINKFDINFCPACGNDLKKTGFLIKSAGEKVLELIKQKRRQIGDVRQLKASEWADKGETSEDKIMKMACFINAIELDKTSARVYNNLGVLYDEKLLINEAISCFRKAVEIDPSYAIAINNLAKCLADNSRCEEACEYYKKAIMLEPANSIFRRNYAETLSRLKKYDESIAEYKKAIELDKTGVSANIAAFKIDLITRRLKGPAAQVSGPPVQAAGEIDKNKIETKPVKTK
jgi:tetratricopeptide (TPR) repeat protein